MKKYSTLIYIIAISFCAKAQSGTPLAYYTTGAAPGAYSESTTIPQWYQNLEKYWFYRYRLVEDFMYMGPDIGEDIIAYKRVKGDLYGGTPLVNVPKALDFEGDQTDDMGAYMAVLGLEHEQLSANGLIPIRQ